MYSVRSAENDWMHSEVESDDGPHSSMMTWLNYNNYLKNSCWIRLNILFKIKLL